MTTKSYRTSGLTCDHCVRAVTTELLQTGIVSSVDIDLHPGETSIVTVSGPGEIDDAIVAEAIDEAGYAVVD